MSLGGSLDPETLKQYVGDADFPAKKEELASKAERSPVGARGSDKGRGQAGVLQRGRPAVDAQ